MYAHMYMHAYTHMQVHAPGQLPTDTLKLLHFWQGCGEHGHLHNHMVMTVNQHKMNAGEHLNNNVSNAFKNGCPLLLGETPDSRTGQEIRKLSLEDFMVP